MRSTTSPLRGEFTLECINVDVAAFFSCHASRSEGGKKERMLQLVANVWQVVRRVGSKRPETVRFWLRSTFVQWNPKTSSL